MFWIHRLYNQFNYRISGSTPKARFCEATNCRRWRQSRGRTWRACVHGARPPPNFRNTKRLWRILSRTFFESSWWRFLRDLHNILPFPLSFLFLVMYRYRIFGNYWFTASWRCPRYPFNLKNFELILRELCKFPLFFQKSILFWTWP